MLDRHAVGITLTLCCSCREPLPLPEGDAVALARAAVAEAVTGGRSTGPERGRSPVFLDTSSVSGFLRMVTRDPVVAFRLTVDDTYRASTTAEVLDCGPDAGQVCEVRDDGILVSVEYVNQNPSGFMVEVSTVTTERRASGAAALCTRTLVLLMVESSEGWSARERRLTKTC